MTMHLACSYVDRYLDAALISHKRHSLSSSSSSSSSSVLNSPSNPSNPGNSGNPGGRTDTGDQFDYEAAFRKCHQ